MVYRVIGLMSGSSLDGLDIAFVELHETSGKWSYTLRHSACYPYSQEWTNRLKNATSLSALDYKVLHAEYGHYLGEQVNHFINENNIQFQVQLIASHGHTTFHLPAKKMTGQLGCGAAIAAVTGINVVSDLRAMDVALGGQGAPIVPIGEELLLGDYLYFLNLGGIANISFNDPDNYVAFDVCPANKVLNLIAARAGKPFDDGGQMAAQGKVSQDLLNILNGLEYYSLPHPKSLSNDFGTDVVYSLVQQYNPGIHDASRTYAEHIAVQVAASVKQLQAETHTGTAGKAQRMLVTGGGVKHRLLMSRLKDLVGQLGVEVEVPADELVDYKEAIIMGLLGVLRWREEYNTLSSVTGATRNSIGGAVWIGQEA